MHRRIGILFNGNKVYDRQVIGGIAAYRNQFHREWQLAIEEDYRCSLNPDFLDTCDAYIADYDDPEVIATMSKSSKPIIAIGGSYQNEDEYPDCPYVATDNQYIARLALEHFQLLGFKHFAFYGIQETGGNRWSREREKAFESLVRESGNVCFSFRGFNAYNYQADFNRLCDWVASLPKPIAVMSATDARAIHLIDACQHLSIDVPEQVSVLGVDDDDVANSICSPTLSSIRQGCHAMGYRAAELLSYQLTFNRHVKRVMIPPEKLVQRESTRHSGYKDHYVRTAVSQVRGHLHEGIRTADIVEKIGLSRSNLETRFHRETGCSLHKYISNSQLARAKELLVSSDKSIADIACLCGYPSVQYLYALFRKEVGMTPKRFRDRNMVRP
ncbi:DNA-binding transcriptional regulator [Sansalvadorimonas sp. 2012CJ34-2]|uniref:DNA-binding transcriptional regulator n=1 Tax=Parendozoicomonas callyspongiae TaxID=2942213 RepID=A0ABT0PKN5_9GAMM|nr:DNA-binding transcriptional regulator [Sansalvadorimonas sp. 2012CJ34-2]MCL6271898.1 DNA-binding transcriptional regulator [Sansalvadorimonas sp. 2012CJ34-2]